VILKSIFVRVYYPKGVYLAAASAEALFAAAVAN